MMDCSTHPPSVGEVAGEPCGNAARLMRTLRAGRLGGAQDVNLASAMKPMNIDAFRFIVPRVAPLLKAMANEDRVLLLMHLADAECDVGQLRSALRIEQPTLSQQLGVLRRAGLVATRRIGKHIYYRTASAEALALVALINTLYCTAADNEAGRAMNEQGRKM